VRIAAADGIAATVISRSYLGGTTRLGLDVEGQRLNALLPAGQPLPAEGQSVRIGFAPADLHLMDDAG
jgi:putative spermidine/putrescine transport system ATP-binding protein